MTYRPICKGAAVCVLLVSVPPSVWAFADDAADASSGVPTRTTSTAYEELVRRLSSLEENKKKLDEEARQLRAIIESLRVSQPIETASLRPMAPPEPAASPVLPAKAEESAPLFLRIGAARFTPGGFLDFINAYRSTNVGSGIGTNFGAIPFANSVGGHMSENRFGAQNSRASLRVDGLVGGTDITGYAEVDFLGSQPTNAYVTSNSDTMRLRLYWADVRRGKWELLGGQAWSLLTPNRHGIAPATPDVFYSQNIDTNYQIGFPWSRAPQFRIVHHTTDHLTLGVSFENPQQYIGAGVALPSAVPPNELDNGSNLATPSLHPDILTKVTYDRTVAGHDLHIEAAGVFRQFRVVRSSDDHRFTQAGAGGSVNANLEIAKGLRTIVNTFYSDGGGRYIFGLGPDLIVRGDGSISPVRAASAMAGLEYQVRSAWLVYAYYGFAYFDRNISYDGKNVIGFGGAGALSANANRVLREPTLGVTRAFWKEPKHGALQAGLQVSRVERSLWARAPSAFDNAYSTMVLTNLRYVLP